MGRWVCSGVRSRLSCRLSTRTNPCALHMWYVLCFLVFICHGALHFMCCVLSCLVISSAIFVDAHNRRPSDRCGRAGRRGGVAALARHGREGAAHNTVSIALCAFAVMPCTNGTTVLCLPSPAQSCADWLLIYRLVVACHPHPACPPFYDGFFAQKLRLHHVLMRCHNRRCSGMAGSPPMPSSERWSSA